MSKVREIYRVKINNSVNVWITSNKLNYEHNNELNMNITIQIMQRRKIFHSRNIVVILRKIVICAQVFINIANI